MQPRLVPYALASLLGVPAIAVQQAAAPPAPPVGAPAPVLTQAEAITIALRDSPTLAAARHERNVGLIDADRARPAFRPEVTASASQVVRTPRVDLPGRPDAVVLPNSISRLELGLRQPVYQFGAGAAPGKRANAMAGAARSDYRAAELDTVQQVREAYLTVLRTRTLAGVAEQSTELARDNVRITKLLEERGVQAVVDILNAEHSLAEAEAQSILARNGAELARAALNRVLGRAIDTPFSVEDQAALPEPAAPLAELTAQAVRDRPEAEALRHQIEAATAGIGLAKASRLPRVTLDVSYALQTETALVPRSGVAAGLTLSAPIFDGAVRRYSVKEAEERLGQLKSALQALEQGVSLEIQQQRLAMEEARSRIQVAERAQATAEKAFEITKARQELGRALQTEVQASRLNVERARISRAGAVYDLQLAHTRLLRALGR